MREATRLAAAALLAVSLCACGSSGGDAQQATDAQPAEEAPAAAEEASKPELQSQDFENVVLVDNDAVTITLEKFYQESSNWARSSGTFEPMTADKVAIKIKDKTEYGTLVNTTAYLDDEKLFCAQSGGNSIDAGKAVNISYTIGKDTQPDWTPLDSFDDLYNVFLDFKIMRKNADGVLQSDSDEIEVNLGKAINGELAPDSEDNDSKNASNVSVEDVDAALQGSWTLDGKSTFTFDNGTAYMDTNTERGGLGGTYEIDLASSYIKGQLQATDGSVDYGIRFTFDGQTLKLINSEGVELTKL